MRIELIEIGQRESRIPENMNFRRYIGKENGNRPQFSMPISGTNLSALKNIGIKASFLDFSIISDSGLSYSEDLTKKISLLHKSNPECDVILFYAAKFKNNINKSYYGSPRKVSLDDVQFLHDFEISLKVSTINACHLLFNEDFGPGGKFPYYENKVFVADALKLGLSVMAIPGSMEIYTEKIYWEKELSSIRQKSLGAALCNIYGIKYIHKYIAVSMGKLIENEKATNRINDWAIAKIELLLKGAYDYLNFTDNGKHIAY